MAEQELVKCVILREKTGMTGSWADYVHADEKFSCYNRLKA